MLTGRVVIYSQAGTGWGCGCRTVGIAGHHGHQPFFWPQPCILGRLPGSSFIPNRGDIWLNRVTLVTLATLPRGFGVPSHKIVPRTISD